MQMADLVFTTFDIWWTCTSLTWCLRSLQLNVILDQRGTNFKAGFFSIHSLSCAVLATVWCTACVLAAEEGYFVWWCLGHSFSLTLQFEMLQQLCIPPVLKGGQESVILRDFWKCKGWKMERAMWALNAAAGPVPWAEKHVQCHQLEFRDQESYTSIKLHGPQMITLHNKTIIKNRTIMSSTWFLGWLIFWHFFFCIFSCLIINIYLIELL